ncbi:FIG00702062: hypothetical protein [hydrothermal vent metagenome]|uniref:ATPase n=1 Tax=hydrothermal vent metagenome TaxID=652676 RepID=A0A3B0YCU2_9ZZZZ
MGTYSKNMRWGAVLVSLFLLSACGGGAETSSNPANNNGGGVAPSSYAGPNALTTDIREFQLNVWEPLRQSNRCGACHVPGIQSPMFVRDDDVNLAYGEATALVDLDAPANSRLVTKVAGGHNCWLTSDAACATIVQNYIAAWANGVSGGQREIQLSAPLVLNDPGQTKSFPASSGSFAATVWPVLTANCAGCHVDSSLTPQSPFFANPNSADDAYEAAKSKMDLNTPANSRLVVRLRDEFHNCFTGSCANDANVMEAAITAFADSVTATVVDPALIISKALTVGDGVVASGGSRYEQDVIALYEFKSMQGNVAIDSSGVEPALHLTLSGNVNWVGGWGIDIVTGRAQGSTTASKKLNDLIKATGEYSVEAWVVPANVVQEGPARIISYSAGTTARNFTMGQTQYNYDFLQRSSTTDANGEVALSTADADQDLQATLQHVVMTFDPINGRRIYVNGVFTGDVDPVAAGNLTEWDDTFALVLGNEVSGDRQWVGQIRMLAIHNRALTQEQIVQNFDVGVGEKFFLLFAIGDVISLPDSYIVFGVSRYDTYSYLFTEPFFINLDQNVTPGNIPLQGMRIGINGREAVVGQAWTSLNTVIDGANYDSVTGQPLATSPRGTIIALENGPATDEFFLTFEQLGSQTNVYTENSPLVPPVLPPPPVVSALGVRTFDEVNAGMAVMTGVDPVLVSSSFQTLRQQLPAVENLDGFLSAHQMAIAQLSIEYCSVMIDDPALSNAFFGVFGFNSMVSSAFGVGDSAEKNQIVDALYNQMVGLADGGSNDLVDAPTREEVKVELMGYDLAGAQINSNSLYDRLTACLPGCDDAARTRAIVKAMCGATLGSAAVLVQ